MTTCTQNGNQSIDKGLYDSSDSLIQRLQHWFDVQRLKANLRRERSQLLSMSDTQFKDIGITREQAMDEARRTDMPEERLKQIASLAC